MRAKPALTAVAAATAFAFGPCGKGARVEEERRPAAATAAQALRPSALENARLVNSIGVSAASPP